MAAQKSNGSRARDSHPRVPPKPRLKLHGFNNLTKSLSFNLYDVCFAARPETVREYIDYIDEVYNADRLTDIMTEVTRIIGAEILNVARQDYDPQGASVTMLIAEEPVRDPETKEELRAPHHTVVGHLDKSHICVHTYPESHPHTGISTFRADIDVSTCGQISPLRALDFLLDSFETDIVTIDYRVRGFTRDTRGKKHYIDHKIHSIQDFIYPKMLGKYQAVDVNVYQENIFHTKLMLKEFNLDNYLFGDGVQELTEAERKKISADLAREMSEIFYARNVD